MVRIHNYYILWYPDPGTWSLCSSSVRVHVSIKYIKMFEVMTPLIAGGDPTGTGKGGASIYGRHFDDEIHEELKHTGEILF
jgi:hypothetical protein